MAGKTFDEKDFKLYSSPSKLLKAHGEGKLPNSLHVYTDMGAVNEAAVSDEIEIYARPGGKAPLVKVCETSIEELLTELLKARNITMNDLDGKPEEPTEEGDEKGEKKSE